MTQSVHQTHAQVVPIHRVRVGQAGRLLIAAAATATMQRLMAMGLLPGSRVKVARVAPLGDPIILELAGFQVSLRRREAEGLSIELDPA